MVLQAAINKVEIYGDARPDVPIVVDGVALREGVRLRGRYGLDTRVDRRLLRLLVFLGLRRVGGVREGWTTAGEMAFLLEHRSSGGGVAKFLERMLDAYRDDHALSPPLTHLIQYEPGRTIMEVGGGREGGRSRGPYRLVRPPGGLTVNVDGAWGFLLGARGYPRSEPRAIEHGLVISDELFQSGDIIGARLAAAATLRDAHLGVVPLGSSNADRMSLATLWDRVANLDMELGAPQLCLMASENALAIYRDLRHPAGQAHVFQLKAHAFGQLEHIRNAVSAAEAAMRLADNAQELRRGLGRAGHIGVLGQRLSKAGRTAMAERKLLHAQRVAEESGATDWASIWALRRAENAIAAGQLVAAEKHLEVSHEWGAPQSTVPHEAARVRITASFMAAANRTAEGQTWAERGYRIGIEKGMANQVRLMLPIMRALGIAPDDSLER